MSDKIHNRSTDTSVGKSQDKLSNDTELKDKKDIEQFDKKADPESADAFEKAFQKSKQKSEDSFFQFANTMGNDNNEEEDKLPNFFSSLPTPKSFKKPKLQKTKLTPEVDHNMAPLAVSQSISNGTSTLPVVKSKKNETIASVSQVSHSNESAPVVNDHVSAAKTVVSSPSSNVLSGNALSGNTLSGETQSETSFSENTQSETSLSEHSLLKDPETETVLTPDQAKINQPENVPILSGVNILNSIESAHIAPSSTAAAEIIKNVGSTIAERILATQEALNANQEVRITLQDNVLKNTEVFISRDKSGLNVHFITGAMESADILNFRSGDLRTQLMEKFPEYKNIDVQVENTQEQYQTFSQDSEQHHQENDQQKEQEKEENNH